MIEKVSHTRQVKAVSRGAAAHVGLRSRSSTKAGERRFMLFHACTTWGRLNAFAESAWKGAAPREF
jgi:hypothetical protein